MGLLDDLLWNIGPELPSLAGRRAGKVLREGEAAEATVVGILVERNSDDTVEPEYRYALDVRTATGVTRVGVRQRASRRSEIALGTVVAVRVLGERVLIDQGVETIGTWRMVDAPAEGVEDRFRRGERKRIAGGVPARVTILRLAGRDGLFGPTENLDLDVRVQAEGVDEGRRIERVLPPDYARALVRRGAVLPAGLDRGGARVTIDWERAANGGA